MFILHPVNSVNITNHFKGQPNSLFQIPITVYNNLKTKIICVYEYKLKKNYLYISYYMYV